AGSLLGACRRGKPVQGVPRAPRTRGRQQLGGHPFPCYGGISRGGSVRWLRSARLARAGGATQAAALPLSEQGLSARKGAHRAGPARPSCEGLHAYLRASGRRVEVTPPLLVT